MRERAPRRKAIPPPVSVAGPIAVDGPVASGKTTVGQLLASRLGWSFVDTGLMYRVAALLALEQGLALDDEPALVQAVEESRMTLDANHVTLADGRDVRPALSDPAVAQAASHVAALPGVRRALVVRQRRLVEEAGGRVVMVGRDIGTVVLPDAPLKVYLDAPPEERARRRLRDEQRTGHDATYERVLAQLTERDRRDQERADSPLRPASDARLIQTGGLSIDQVVDVLLDVVRQTVPPS